MTLEPLSIQDRDLILEWRNAPQVRQHMYTTHEITLEEHRKWYERVQEDPEKAVYLYRDRTGSPNGVVSFTDLNTAQGSVFWGFYTKPGAEAGTGTRILYKALETAFNVWALHKVCGEALATNEASSRLHLKCGFTQEGTFREQFFDGSAYIDIIRFGILANEWPMNRTRLDELL